MAIRKGRRQPGRHQAGLTLLEIVITLVVLGIVAAVTGQPLITLIQSRNSISAAASEQSDIDYALARMAKQIRLDGAGGITTCDETELVVNNAEGEESRYAVRSGHLIAGDDRLVENVDTPDSGRKALCQAVDPDLRLYRIRLGVNGESYSVRAFQRDGGIE